MEIAALAGNLEQPLYTAVLAHQRGELGKHRFAVDPAEGSPQLTAGDHLLRTGAVGDIRIRYPQAGYPVTDIIKHRGPGNAADLENGFQGLPQDELVTLGQGIGNRPGDGAGDQFEVFPEPVIQGPLHRPQSDVDGDATE